MRILITISLLFSMTFVFGQDTFKESKVFTKELSFKDGEEINITGERTFIYMTEWDKNIVQAEVEVVSRYKNQEQAQNDLEKVNVTFEKKGKTVYYSNALKIKSAKDKPKSNLKTILRISIPSYAKVTIKNAFGELNVEGSVEELECVSQFSSTYIKEFTGDMNIISKYGKIKCEDTNGKMNVEGNRSDLSLVRVGGEVEAGLSYGNLDIAYGLKNIIFDISTEYSPVTVILPENSKHRLNLACSDCDINIDNCNRVADEKISRGNHNVTIGSGSGVNPKSKITSKQENITVITTNSLSNSN